MSTDKGTKMFTEKIKQYVEDFALGDPVFLEKYRAPGKTIEKCVQYILNEVKKSGACGFDNSEIYKMAIHYYDEESIDIGKAINMEVKVNYHVEFTDEDRADIKEKAKLKAIEQEKNVIISNKMKADERAKKKAEAKAEEMKKKAEELKKTQSTLF